MRRPSRERGGLSHSYPDVGLEFLPRSVGWNDGILKGDLQLKDEEAFKLKGEEPKKRELKLNEEFTLKEEDGKLKEEELKKQELKLNEEPKLIGEDLKLKEQDSKKQELKLNEEFLA